MPAPIFTRRHYCAIAGLIRDAAYLEPETRTLLVSELSVLFAGDNERFQPDRFREAATPESDKIEVRGLADGKAAGSWVIDGRTSDETAAAILRGIE
jgi:hypothetical protein